MSGVKILHFLKDWWKSIPIHQNYTMALIMQIYANLFKINEKCYFSVISWPILILFGLSDQ